MATRVAAQTRGKTPHTKDQPTSTSIPILDFTPLICMDYMNSDNYNFFK